MTGSNAKARKLTMGSPKQKNNPSLDKRRNIYTNVIKPPICWVPAVQFRGCIKSLLPAFTTFFRWRPLGCLLLIPKSGAVSCWSEPDDGSNGSGASPGVATEAWICDPNTLNVWYIGVSKNRGTPKISLFSETSIYLYLHLPSKRKPNVGESVIHWASEEW